MEESHEKIDNIKDRYRELLSNLTGVFAANVDIAEDGSIREIHILGSQNRNPKQIARDVQSLWPAPLISESTTGSSA